MDTDSRPRSSTRDGTDGRSVGVNALPAVCPLGKIKSVGIQKDGISFVAQGVGISIMTNISIAEPAVAKGRLNDEGAETCGTAR